MGYARSNDEFFEVGKMVLYSLNFGNLSPDCKAIFQKNATTAVNQLSNPGERVEFQNAFKSLVISGDWPGFLSSISNLLPYFTLRIDPEVSHMQSFSTTIKDDLYNYHQASSGNDKIVAFAKLQMDVKRGLGTVDDQDWKQVEIYYEVIQSPNFPQLLSHFNYWISRSKSSVTMSTDSTQWISIYPSQIMSLQDDALNQIDNLARYQKDYSKEAAYLNSLLGYMSFCQGPIPTPPSINIKNQQGLSNDSAEAEFLKTLELMVKILITANQLGVSKNNLHRLIHGTTLHPHTKKLLANALMKKL